MKVIIAGSRNFNDQDFVEKIINESRFNITEVVSGNTNGVDKCGEEWAKKNNIHIKYFKPKWNDINVSCAIAKRNKYGQLFNVLAGHMRNEEMGKYTDALIAISLNESRGTKNMINFMKKLQKPYYICYIYDELFDDYRIEFKYEKNKDLI